MNFTVKAELTNSQWETPVVMTTIDITTSASDDTSAFFRVASLFVFVTITSYITLAQLVYEVKARREEKATKIFANSAKRRKSLSGDVSGFPVRMRACCVTGGVLASVMFLLKLGFSILHLATEDIHACEVMLNSVFILHTWTRTSVFLLLWLRQRLFYSHPGTSHLTSASSRLLSCFSLFAIAANAAVVPALFGLARHFAPSHDRCHFVAESRLAFAYLVATGATSVCFQASLLYLFVVPLLKHNSNILPSKRRHNEGLLSVVKRACCVTLLCVISDVILIVSVSLLSRSEKIQSTIEDVIIVTNVVGANLTFVDWRKRLFPWKQRGLTSTSVRLKENTNSKATSEF